MKSKTEPKISVIMSVYNGEKYLKEAIDSILEQTLRDFEFIIIDDDSGDNTLKILKEYAKKDSRIKIIKNKKNIGLTKSLNKAIQEAKGEYIARMDADDISLPKRLEKQMKYLNSHIKVGAVGCWFYKISEKNKLIEKQQLPIEFSKIKKRCFFIGPFAHSSALIRRDVLEKVGFYDERFIYSQDRDLWLRILKHYHLGNIPEYLLKFRYSKNSITKNNEIKQKIFCLKALLKAIKNGIYPKWYYVFLIRIILSIYLPKPLREIKKKIWKKLGLII